MTYPYNPFALLGIEISENVEYPDILKAIIKQIRTYCNDPKNNPDQKYLMDMFCEAGYSILDPESRKEIIENMKKEKAQESTLSSKSQEENKAKNEELKDVKNTFICVYDENQVGLFKRIPWVSNRIDMGIYDAGDVYVGIDTDYIGLRTTHDGSVSWDEWDKAGEKVKVEDIDYISNCDMYESIHFENMRLKMYQDQKIDPYERGKATPKEILDVLCYAKDYYQINQNDHKFRGSKV